MIKGLTIILIILIPFLGICQDYVNPTSYTTPKTHKKKHQKVIEGIQPSYIDSIAEYITVKPKYSDGEQALLKRTSNITLPLYAIQNNIHGTVKIRLIINKEGSIVQTEFINGLGYGCDEKALKIIEQTANNWFPAKQYTKNVYDSIIVSIHFNTKANPISKKATGIFNKGVKLYNNKNYANALSFFKVANDLSNNYIDALFYIGNCHLKLNKKDEACKYWTKSFDLGKIDNEKTYMQDYCSGDLDNKQTISSDSIKELTAVDSVIFTKEFQFKNGIYRTFEEFKFNEPYIKYKEVLDDKPSKAISDWGFDNDPIMIIYRDKEGLRKKLRSKEAWGYCKDGKVFIRSTSDSFAEKYFLKLEIIGAIMQTVTEKVVYHTVHTHNINGVSVNSGNAKHSLDVKIIDFEMGESSNYNVENFMQMLKKDTQLFQEFSSIKTNLKKKQMMFMYLKRFNKRNPIYFYKNTYN